MTVNRAAVLLMSGGALAMLLAAQAPLRGQGPGPGFSPIHEPRFVSTGQANFLKSEDRVLGVSEGGTSRAYPVFVLAWHHIVQDRLGDVPIVATW